MNKYKSIDYKGMTISVYYDENAESPRDWDNLGTIYSSHRDYNPDNHRLSELRDEYEESGEGAFKYYLDKRFYWLPIGYYEHSGITIWAGGPNGDWDSGSFGIIAVTKERARREYSGDETTVKERALSCLNGEIKDLDTYFRGEVYGFRIEDEDGDMIDSCWGFLGDEGLKDIISEAKSVIDDEIEKREADKMNAFKSQLAKHIAMRKAQIKNNAPLYARVAFAFDW